MQTLEAEDSAKKTIHTRMGVVFSLLKDNKKETDVEYPSQLVSMPKPVQKRPKAYSDEDIIKLFSAMVDEEGRPDNEEKARFLCA